MSGKLPTHLLEDIEKTLFIQQWKLDYKYDFWSISGREDGITEIPEKALNLVKKSSIHRSLQTNFFKKFQVPYWLIGWGWTICWYLLKKGPLFQIMPFKVQVCQLQGQYPFFFAFWHDDIWPERLLKCNWIRGEADESNKKMVLLIIKGGGSRWICELGPCCELEE